MAVSILEQIKKCGWPFELAKDYDGHCPCADFIFRDDEGAVQMRSRCWRVSGAMQELHVWGKHTKIKEIARAMKRELDNTEWYGEYEIFYKEFK